MTYALSPIVYIFMALCGSRVLAFTISDGINDVAPTLPAGGSTFGSILLNVASSFIPVAVVAATLAMTLSGFFLALSGNEAQQTTARRVFISSLAGIALLNIVPIFASALISGSGFNSSTFKFTDPTVLSNATNSGNKIAAEALGLVTFLEIPLGILCVIMIIISGIRAIINLGSEDGIAQLRRTVLFIVAGFILVYTRGLLVVGDGTFAGIADGGPGSIINVILTTLNKIIFFIIAIAVAMIIYAGMLMIVNIGREEQYSKAKALILRVGIGLLIMIASGGIILLLTGIL